MTAKKMTAAHDEVQISSETLIGDFKALMADAEDLIKATAGHEEGPLSAIRSKALETLNSAKESLSSVEGTLTEKAKVVAEGADEFVHRNPWEAVGVAAGLGLLIGLFIRRR
ncbi:YqjD family protein [Polynucleobacter sp. AM-25C3]|jgi:ElaB/YqjD/DUF883 family membrane-anchored ribosome-binding protein|uniref:DUF883 family protein n=1 Tax=Polynucleobacter sp. AM-25C3 TaxID=1855569 RepID=UPI001C0B073B|nr:DUF883 family protein [Polynucleobacter sp. AM-25C3]MBU3602773.1 DUF883 domain-containing protein [Polynucleobacter sp. AM-25C3]